MKISSKVNKQGNLVEQAQDGCTRCSKGPLVYDASEKEVFCNSCGFILKGDISAKIITDATIDRIKAWDGTRAFK